MIIRIVLVLLLSTTAYAGQKTYGDATVSSINSVYDGDTFRCDIKGWPAIIGKNISIRIAGIDTPEKRGTTGRIKDLAMAARMVTAHTLKSGVVELKNMRRGKYFRIVADVYVDGRSIADLLIENGMAKPYGGGRKPKW